MKDYLLNPILRAAVLEQLPALPASAEKRSDGAEVSTIVGSRGEPLIKEFKPREPEMTAAAQACDEIRRRYQQADFKDDVLPPPGDSGELRRLYQQAVQRQMDGTFKEVCSDASQNPSWLIDENGVLHSTSPLPPPGDTGEESISAQQEMRMACAWLLSLNEEDAIQALGVIRTMREGYVSS